MYTNYQYGRQVITAENTDNIGITQLPARADPQPLARGPRGIAEA